jgi:hypothetical protein
LVLSTLQDIEMNLLVVRRKNRIHGRGRESGGGGGAIRGVIQGGGCGGG